MRAHIAAVKARIAPLRPGTPYAVHDGYAGSKAQTLPYVVLGAPGWDSPDDVPLCGATEDLDADMRVKAVAANADAVRAVLDQVRNNLSLGKASTVLVVAGRKARIKFVRSEFVAEDASVTLTDGTHPTQGVDTYRITSQPTG